ncbi:hypothetical protein K0M31_008081 [Melipona bicolor]|uniref:Uncharacterized protein n=1 Tax=Melipona bicolor TaxID=60889 RepID=A0AA40KK70_9HYME|nr:hypothetical protein K0M31_008081 [Melipona bicolor]
MERRDKVEHLPRRPAVLATVVRRAFIAKSKNKEFHTDESPRRRALCTFCLRKTMIKVVQDAPTKTFCNGEESRKGDQGGRF